MSISAEKAFHSRATNWVTRFNQTSRVSDNIEFGSSEYHKLWGPIWEEFDKLEQSRIAGEFSRPTWYDRTERQRKTFENAKSWKSESSTLTTEDWSQVPLGVILENHLGGPVCAGQKDITRALERWNQFRKTIAEQPEFQRSLSYSQKVSWTLLGHWWSAAYQDSSLSKAAITRLEALKASSNDVEYFHNEPHLDKEAFAQSRNSLYNSTMYTLFNQEFNPNLWSNHFKAIHLMTVKQVREKGSEIATAQRFAYSSYATIQGVEVQKVGSYLASPDMPCPWLSRKGKDKQDPYFLWDVQLQRTVIVDEMPIKPEYCCVSHTWGRWRMEKVPIEGVPWLVPSNQRFDVKSLPEHLKRIQPRTPFVWIDLFCIPQDKSIKAAEEINRQAIIFQNASRCIAWMNDVTDWTRTLKALDWIGISFIHASTAPDIYETEKHLDPLYRGAQEDSEMFTKKVEITEGANLHPIERNPQQIAIAARKLAEPACWFSSLWTLQEAMLCSNLTFVSRDWMPLEDRSGTAIPLDGFFRILNALQSVWNNDKPYRNWTDGYITKYPIGRTCEDEKWPDGARQLLFLGLVTRMDQLLESPEPVKLLMIANTRQSTSSRAPAIMSALGMTDWYNPNENRHSKTNLVLECYPFAFVNEAAEKIGARFYASEVGKASAQHDTLDRSTKGSMMPFSANIGWFAPTISMPATYGYTSEDNPAVKTWSIKPDGTVEVKQAGILASTDQGPNDESSLRVFHTERDGTPIRFIDWVNELPKGMSMYAVSLFRSSGWQKGILVRGHKKGLFSSAQRLIKSGTFVIPDFQFPSTANVNWIVW